MESYLFDNSLLDKSNIRRSPRIQEKSRKIENSIRVPSDNLIYLENQSPFKFNSPKIKSPSSKRKSETLPKIAPLNLEDIFDIKPGSPLKNPEIVSFDMEISESLQNSNPDPYPLYPPKIKNVEKQEHNKNSENVKDGKDIKNKSISLMDMEISETKPVKSPRKAKTPKKILDANLETFAMENSSLNDIGINYSQVIVQKSKEHQQKILNISQDFRAILSMSISECADIINQSGNVGKSEPKSYIIPDRNTLRMVNIYRDLQISFYFFNSEKFHK